MVVSFGQRVFTLQRRILDVSVMARTRARAVDTFVVPSLIKIFTIRKVVLPLEGSLERLWVSLDCEPELLVLVEHWPLIVPVYLHQESFSAW